MRPAATRSAGRPATPRPRGTGPDVTVLGGQPGAARATGGITLGVEEESRSWTRPPASLS